jgi:integrase
MQRKRNHAGIQTRHGRSCSSHDGGRCNCRPRFQVHVWSNRERRRIWRTFDKLSEAKAWRAEASTKVRKGEMSAPTRRTLEEAAAEFLAGAADGSIRRNDGRRYAPGTIRTYEQNLRLRLLPELGYLRLSEITRQDVIRLVRELTAAGLAPVTINVALNPLRAIVQAHLDEGTLTVNPTTKVKLPRGDRGRQRIADAAEAAALLDALPSEDRALWATALYGGLRRGELRALRWTDVDLAQGIIRVERGWDDREGEQQTKGRNRRRVPITGILRDYLAEHGMASGRTDGFVFGDGGSEPFKPYAVTARADRAWKQAELERITLHECRHTFAC